MSGVSARNYKAVIPEMAETTGVSRSAVSRAAIEASEAELGALLNRRFDELKLLVIYVDGLIFGDYTMLLVAQLRLAVFLRWVVEIPVLVQPHMFLGSNQKMAWRNLEDAVVQRPPHVAAHRNGAGKSGVFRHCQFNAVERDAIKLAVWESSIRTVVARLSKGRIPPQAGQVPTTHDMA